MFYTFYKVIECLLFYSTMPAKMPAKMLVWYSELLNVLSKKKCTHVHNTIWIVLGASLLFKPFASHSRNGAGDLQWTEW